MRTRAAAGSTTARGYGTPHQRVRARWEPVVAAGRGWCAELICLMPTRWIRPGTPWHLAHAPDGSYRGPAHQRCNIAERNRRCGNRPRRWRTRKAQPPPRW
jgi:hypothetical protein